MATIHAALALTEVGGDTFAFGTQTANKATLALTEVGGDTFDFQTQTANKAALAYTEIGGDGFDFVARRASGGATAGGGGPRTGTKDSHELWKRLREEDYCILRVIEKWVKSQ